MAESKIPTPPHTPPPVPGPVATEPIFEVSIERLDSLLESYLELLDEYTKLRTQLSSQFSDGFFSLARANHTSSSLCSGRRYGEEGYDERMKAQRCAVYSSDSSKNSLGGISTETKSMHILRTRENQDRAAASQRYRISIQRTEDVAKTDQTSAGDLEQSERTEASAQLSVEDSGTVLSSSRSQANSQPSLESKAKVKTSPSGRDPLNWYGILIPQPLRQAQAAFVSAVESSIPQLHNTSASMHDLETQITKLRFELGLQQCDVVDQEPDGDTRARERVVGALSPSSQLSKSAEEAALVSAIPRRRLIQGPSEPRSRMLKLDG